VVDRVSKTSKFRRRVCLTPAAVAVVVLNMNQYKIALAKVFSAMDMNLNVALPTHVVGRINKMSKLRRKRIPLPLATVAVVVPKLNYRRVLMKVILVMIMSPLYLIKSMTKQGKVNVALPIHVVGRLNKTFQSRRKKFPLTPAAVAFALPTLSQ